MMKISGHFAIKRNYIKSTLVMHLSRPYKSPLNLKVHTCLEPDAHNRRHGGHHSTPRPHVRTNRRPTDRWLDRRSDPARSTEGFCRSTTPRRPSDAADPFGTQRRRRNQAAAAAILTVGRRLNTSGKRSVDDETTADGRRSV